MPKFKLDLRRVDLVDPDEVGLELRDLHAAHPEACAAVGQKT